MFDALLSTGKYIIQNKARLCSLFYMCPVRSAPPYRRRSVVDQDGLNEETYPESQ